jgi:putative transposase
LRREGWEINLKKTHRIYNELRLQSRNKTPKRRVKAKLRDDRRAASTSNEVRAMDFVHDQLATGQKIRALTVVDTFSRFSPAIDPKFSYRAEDVVATLERVCDAMGYPKTIRVDQGSEFVSRDLDLWAYTRGVTLDFSRPGKPTGNAFIEAFNGRLGAECLNPHCSGRLPTSAKAGGLAQGLQRGSAAWGDRQQAPGFPHNSRRRTQPADVT